MEQLIYRKAQSGSFCLGRLWKFLLCKQSLRNFIDFSIFSNSSFNVLSKIINLVSEAVGHSCSAENCSEKLCNFYRKAPVMEFFYLTKLEPYANKLLNMVFVLSNLCSPFRAFFYKTPEPVTGEILEEIDEMDYQKLSSIPPNFDHHPGPSVQVCKEILNSFLI